MCLRSYLCRPTVGSDENINTEVREMSKFYVQSGELRLVLVAETVELAAIAAVDTIMSQHLWIYEEETLRDEIRRDHLMVEALCQLDAVIQINERGFDREDSVLIGTPEVVEEWHLLMTRLSGLFVAAGLPPRSLPLRGIATSPAIAT